jgi:cysteine synthase
LWTTGTMTGISKFLKEKDKNIVSLWIIRKPNNPIPWPRTKSLLSQISFNWNDFVNETIEIGTKESYVKSLEMIRYGLVVWPSSWFALAWILEFIKKKKKHWICIETVCEKLILYLFVVIHHFPILMNIFSI